MKKAIALLLALALVGGAVFAQELKFSGYLDTGVAIFDDGTNDPTIGLWGDDSGTTTRFNLQAAYTNENVGATARLRMQNDLANGSAGNLFVNRAFAWATMLDGMVKTVAGKLGDYTWATTANYFGNLDTQTGFQVQVMPIDGLNVGFFLPAAGAATQLVGDALKDIQLGLSYSMEGIGSFVAGYNMSPVAESSSAYFGANISAVENLAILIEGQMSDIGAADAETYLFEEFDYTMDALNVGIDLEQTLSSDANVDMALAFTPYVSYDMGTFVPGFVFTYAMQGDVTDMYLNPYVKYNVGPKAVIEVGGKINSGDTNDSSRYYLAYTWSF